MIIYRITNIASGKCYIGLTKQSLAERWQGHKERAARGMKTALYDAIRSYGKDGFTIEVIAHLIPTLDFDDLKELEKNIIQQENTKLPNGYNMTDGGDGTAGYKPSAEVLAKRIGKKASPETRAKMSISQKGRKHTEEAKKKIGVFNKGKIVSEETRRKQGVASKGRVIKNRKATPEGLAKIKAAAAKRWADPVFREKVTSNMRKPKKRKVA